MNTGRLAAALKRQWGPLRPRFRIGFSPPWTPDWAQRIVLPFQRSWPAIIFSGVLLGIFSIPLFTVPGMFDFKGGGDLFSLVFNTFIAAWLLGWSTGVAAIALVFLVLLCGREVLIARPDHVLLRMEISGFGFGVEMDPAYIRNLRTETSLKGSGTSWRGPHMVFDYGGHPVQFGSALEGARAEEVRRRFEQGLGGPVPTGAHPPLPASPEAPDSSQQFAPGTAPDPIGAGSPSVLALIAANLMVLAGALFLDWRLDDVMVLYWAESAVIGIYNLLKMIRIGGWRTLLAGPFFLGHYGGFMAAHFLFIYVLFVQGPGGGAGPISLSEVAETLKALWPAIAALFISHGISYCVNFLGRREYAGRTLGQQMHEPYRRIIIMHVTIIFGGFVTLALGTPLPILVLLIVLKTAADVKAHLKERRGTSWPANRG